MKSSCLHNGQCRGGRRSNTAQEVPGAAEMLLSFASQAPRPDPGKASHDGSTGLGHRLVWDLDRPEFKLIFSPEDCDKSLISLNPNIVTC